jgi:hypothetical protein
MPDNRQVRSAVPLASSMASFIKGDIKNPVQSIFNRPMRSHYTL